MHYYRYRAYDKNTNEVTGVDRASRWEAMVLMLHQRGLTPAMVEVISAEEYKRFKTAQVHIQKFKKLQTKLEPKDNILVTNSKPVSKISIIIAISVALAIIGIIAYMA